MLVQSRALVTTGPEHGATCYPLVSSTLRSFYVSFLSTRFPHQPIPESGEREFGLLVYAQHDPDSEEDEGVTFETSAERLIQAIEGTNPRSVRFGTHQPSLADSGSMQTGTDCQACVACYLYTCG